MRKRFVLLSFVSIAVFIPQFLFAAEDSLTLSVTPPLFQLNVEPGQSWQSYIKVINSNPYELTVYANVVNFIPKGEEGLGNFIPLSESGGEDVTLGEWISITGDPVVIPPERSFNIPITVATPQNAAPGGHFAAVLIGTKPPEIGDVSAVRTSQFVTSLFFLKVSGDVKEEGSIREFSVDRAFHSTPEAQFSLRFDNTGNVHLQPKGDITIFNMWGKERGYIPINQKSHFGNVLPNSIRKFEFTWKGESSITDIGRYTAVATLTYGEEGRKNVDQKLYFWVIPVKATLVTLGSFALIVWLLFFMVRRYVRRALYLSGFEPQTAEREASLPQRPRSSRVRVLSAPLREGVLDLRRTIEKQEDAKTTRFGMWWQYAIRYKFFFAGILVVLMASGAGSVYLLDVLKGEKSYEVVIDHGDATEVMSSEEVIKDRLDEQAGKTELTTSLTKQSYDLMLINATDEPGAGARLASALEEQGYVVGSIMQDAERRAARSSIVYVAQYEDAAKLLSQRLGNMLISVATDEAEAGAPGIRVIIGDDFKTE